ncbi:MAG TPA: hypothetical protein VFF30_19115 [Nitrososphaerales archaeon]|nr:hypothetical protein [Nitrososphaerales archaeon]
MVDRNAIIGLDFLVIGGVVSALGYTVAQSVPIASFGFALALIGALLFLIVPESVPHDAYSSMLKDAISNVELILEESGLRSKAWFVLVEAEGKRKNGKETGRRADVRAFVPFETATSVISSKKKEEEESGTKSRALTMLLDEESARIPRRFITSFGTTSGLLLIPPGSEIARIAGVIPGGDIEEALSSVLVEFSDLCTSVLAIEDVDKTRTMPSGDANEVKSIEIKISIKGARLLSESPYFNACLGSPLSCISACVVAILKQAQVTITDEKIDGSLIRLTLEAISPKQRSMEEEEL